MWTSAAALLVVLMVVGATAQCPSDNVPVTSVSCACPAGQQVRSVPSDLGGQILSPGCYVGTPSTGALALTGTLTLNGAGSYLFSTVAALNTAANSVVALTNGARCSSVTWCIGGAVTLGAASTFNGNMQTGPAAPITIGAVSVVRGSMLAGNQVVNIGAGASILACPAASSVVSAGNPGSSACPAGVAVQSVAADLGGQTLLPGCYVPIPSSAAFALTGTLILSGSGSFFFSTPAAFNTAANSVVSLTNGASCSSISWNIGGAVTLGAVSFFSGNVQTGPTSAITIGAASFVSGVMSAGNSVVNIGAAATVTNCGSGLVSSGSPPVTPPACGCPVGVSPTVISGALGGVVLVPGCYSSVAAFGLTGIVTLNGAGSYVFITPAALTTAAASIVLLSNGAQCSNVRWCIGAAATFGAVSTFSGSVVTGPAGAITIGAGAQISGSLSAGNGVVTIGAGALVVSCGGVVSAPPPPPPAALDCSCPAGYSVQAIGGPLAALALAPGCYSSVAAFGLTGVLTLSGNGPYIFTSPAALTTAAASVVTLTNGASCADVNWCLGAAANLGATSLFSGNIQTAGAAITLGAGAVVHGSVNAGGGVINYGAGSTSAPCA